MRDSPRKEMQVFKRILVAGAAVAAFGAVTASAQATTVSLGTPQLSGKVWVAEPVTVSCSPFDPSLILYSEYVTVSVEQASAQGIAHGSGSVSSVMPTYLFPCDNSSHTVVINVLADDAGRPFHGGAAVFTATANIAAGTPCFPGSTTCLQINTYQNGTAGPTTMNLH
jgi:hypothetical protein